MPIVASQPDIKELKLSELRPADYNTRIISEAALTGLASSLRKFGCVEPIVVFDKVSYTRKLKLSRGGFKELIRIIYKKTEPTRAEYRINRLPK